MKNIQNKYSTFKILFNTALGMISLFAFTACEDVINVDLPQGEVQLVVDAWITNQTGEQSIKLTRSASYFDNNPSPAALGATVQITDNEGNTYNFLDADNDGKYVWIPNDATPLGKIGNTYTLQITFEGETYKAESAINPVPAIDSIAYELREEELGNPKGYYAEVYARDFAGKGNCYWIRGFKNERYLNRVSNLTTAYDAGFSAGGNTDGINFIRPIREGINEFVPDAGSATSFTTPPYKVGDKIKVELYSITESAFNFFGEVRSQLQNSGLFAIPLANVSSNLVNQNPNSKVRALGFFGASAVSVLEGTLEDKEKGAIKPEL